MRAASSVTGACEAVTSTRGRGAAREQRGQPRDVLLEDVEHRRGVERSGRVVERVEGHRAPAQRHVLLLAVHARDPERAAGEQRRREAAEGGHDAGAYELQLTKEVGLARGSLFRQRVAVARRPALQHRREVHLVEGQADAAEQPLEELSGPSRERRAFPVLVESRRLADERELRIRVALAEDHLRAPTRERAPHAAGSLGGDRFQGCCPLRRVQRRELYGPVRPAGRVRARSPSV